LTLLIFLCRLIYIFPKKSIHTKQNHEQANPFSRVNAFKLYSGTNVSINLTWASCLLTINCSKSIFCGQSSKDKIKTNLLFSCITDSGQIRRTDCSQHLHWKEKKEENIHSQVASRPWFWRQLLRLWPYMLNTVD
jgi:hypothetical protein